VTGKLVSCPICIFKEMCIRDGRQIMAADLRAKVGGEFGPEIGCNASVNAGLKFPTSWVLVISASVLGWPASPFWWRWGRDACLRTCMLRYQIGVMPKAVTGPFDLNHNRADNNDDRAEHCSGIREKVLTAAQRSAQRLTVISTSCQMLREKMVSVLNSGFESNG